MNRILDRIDRPQDLHSLSEDDFAGSPTRWTFATA